MEGDESLGHPPGDLRGGEKKVSRKSSFIMRNKTRSVEVFCVAVECSGICPRFYHFSRVLFETSRNTHTKKKRERKKDLEMAYVVKITSGGIKLAGFLDNYSN